MKEREDSSVRARVYMPFPAESNGRLSVTPIRLTAVSDRRRSRKRRAYVIVRLLVYQQHLSPTGFDPEL